MELALQVVGLKMTGKIEDAKNVAMRIVGNAGAEGSNTQTSSVGMMQLASLSSAADFGSMLVRPSEGSDLEKKIIDLLSVLDTPLEDSTAIDLPVSEALSWPSKTGQTLLHLATYLKFPTLSQFLIDRNIDIDARDRNGYTALHFAALVQSSECAKLLIDAGADREVVNSLGKIPREIAPSDFFDAFCPEDVSESEDEEAGWGDGEEDAVEELRSVTLRRKSSRLTRKTVSGRSTVHHSVDVSRAATPPPSSNAPGSSFKLDMKKMDEKPLLDEKGSFMEKMIQRTLAQLPGQGFIPQLPLPHLPDLPNMPWAALPQMPMVFPVYVPMVGWPSFLGGETTSDDSDRGEGQARERKRGASAMRAAHEWWEKWMALAAATTARQQAGVEEPPPMYTAEPGQGEVVEKKSTTSTSFEEPSTLMRVRRRSAVVEPFVEESVSVGETSEPSQQEKKELTQRSMVKQKSKNYKSTSSSPLGPHAIC